jgi:hypothetical protein
MAQLRAVRRQVLYNVIEFGVPTKSLIVQSIKIILNEAYNNVLVGQYYISYS